MIDLRDKSLFIEVNLHDNSEENVVVCTREENDCKLLKEIEESSEIPLSIFGVLTDIQYADHDIQTSFDMRNRNYRNSLSLVQDAVGNWKKYSIQSQRKLDFILELGDIIDGKCKSLNDSLKSMNKVLRELKNGQEENQILHVWGNHEFYNFKRSEIIELELNTTLNLKQNFRKTSNYYYYDVTEFLRIICLDFYEFSILGYDPDDKIYLEAAKYINSLEKSESYPCPTLNGAVKSEQLKWLKDQLNICKSLNKKVILCGHNPLLKEASKEKFLSLNSAQILELLWSYDNLILAYMCGHYHAGGYCKDKYGIHHITLPGIIEKTAGTNSFMTVKVYNNRIQFFLNNN